MPEHHALIRDGRITNVIVVEDGDPQQFMATIAADYDATARVDDLDPQPGIGWRWQSGAPVPPPSLSTDKNEITGNGTDVATVTYTDAGSDVPAEVTLDVNGATQTVAVANGSAAVGVTSSSPGDTVTVSCEGLSLTIGVV